MLNLTFSLYNAKIIDISDRYKGTPGWILNALVEEAMTLLEKNELLNYQQIDFFFFTFKWDLLIKRKVNSSHFKLFPVI